MKGTLIIPGSDILLSSVTLESGIKVIYQDRTINELMARARALGGLIYH